MSDESIKPPSSSGNSLNPGIDYVDKSKIKMQVKFDGNCLKQEKVASTHKQVANIYIFYEINLWPFNVGQDLILVNCLFGAVKFTKNNDPVKYVFCLWYWIWCKSKFFVVWW